MFFSNFEWFYHALFKPLGRPLGCPLSGPQGRLPCRPLDHPRGRPLCRLFGRLLGRPLWHPIGRPFGVRCAVFLPLDSSGLPSVRRTLLYPDGKKTTFF